MLYLPGRDDAGMMEVRRTLIYALPQAGKEIIIARGRALSAEVLIHTLKLGNTASHDFGGSQANDGGLIRNLISMTKPETRLLSDDFEVILPINRVSSVYRSGCCCFPYAAHWLLLLPR